MDAMQENRGYQLVSVTATFLAIVWILVPLRCSVRLFIMKDFQLDDYILVFALFTFTLMSGFFFAAVHYGLGRHGEELSLSDETNALKFMSLATIVYIASTAVIKTSIAIFLLRLAVQKKYIWIIRVSIAIVIIWTTAIFFFNIFQCTPIESQWDPNLNTAGSCVPGASYVSAAYSFSALTIVSDWLYALIPIPMIWDVKMNTHLKLSVLVVLALGIFASIATLVRCFYLAHLADSDDILYTTIDTLIWTVAEPGLGIAAAAIVTLRPLLRALKVPGFASKYESRASNSERDSRHRFRLSHVHEVEQRAGAISLQNSGLRMHSDLSVGGTWELPSNARFIGDTESFNPFGDNAVVDTNSAKGSSVI